MKVTATDTSNGLRGNSERSSSYYTADNRERIARKNMMQRRRRTVVFGTVLSAAMLSVILVSSISFSSKARGDHELYKCYTSVEIMPGDSLWSIADGYSTAGYYDRLDYIDEIKTVNHILGDDIQAGEYLVLPYYTVNNN